MRPIFAAACLTLAFTGCNSANLPDTGEVSGTITIDGKPATGIRVRFTPVGPGRPSSGESDAAGHYSLVYSANGTGALIGKHIATIFPTEPSADVPEPGKVKMSASVIPKKYATIEKEVEVKAGSNSIDLVYP